MKDLQFFTLLVGMILLLEPTCYAIDNNIESDDSPVVIQEKHEKIKCCGKRGAPADCKKCPKKK